MIKRILIVALSFMLPQVAEARTLGQLLSDSSDRRALVASLQDQGTGISTANSFLKITGKATFYCPPARVFLTGEQYLDILSRYVDTDQKRKEAPANAVAGLLVLALVDAFPCQ